MGFVSDLNSAHIMEAMVTCFSCQLGFKYAEKAYEISKNCQESCFKDFREFVSLKAHVAMSRYGAVGTG